MVSSTGRAPAQVPTAVSSPLPPDRPLGDESEKLEDVAQEFLTDWLVRQNVDESLHFMSQRAMARVDTDDDDDEIRDQGAVAALRASMELSVDEMGDMDNLTEAIDVILPWRESMRIPEHSFQDDFALLELTDGDASVYLCGEPPETSTPDAYGRYYATLFRFKRQGSGTLRILWVREAGNWRIVAWEVFEQ